MQYKRQAMSIARGKSIKANIVSMFSRPAYCLATGLSVLLLSGCADGVSDLVGLQRMDVIRGYDSTLTKTEKEAAISELQEDKERQQAQVEQSDSAPKSN